MKDIKVGVEKMTRNCCKMIKQTGESLLLSKHSIQLSALFLLLSVSELSFDKIFFQKLFETFWDMISSEKLGQPFPASNFVVDSNRDWLQEAQV